MGTIVARKRKDGTTGFTAQVLKKQGGKIVWREAQTFDRKQAATAWIKKRETELAEPGGVERARAPKGKTLADAIDKYTETSRKEIGRTKEQVLRSIKGYDIAGMDAAATFGLALSQQDTAGAAAENSFRPAGALVFPEKLSTKGTGAGSTDDVITKFKERFVGSLKANEVMVLDGGAKFETFSFNSKDSEFLESRKLSNMDICRVFLVPPSVAGITDNSTYSNVGEESRALVTRCLAPMAKRIEQAMNVALLTPESRKTFFIEHDLNGLTRGDLAQRYGAYAIGRNGGWLNVNEIRKMENMSKVADGDTYAQPLNMGIVGANDNRNKVEDAA